MVFNNIAFCTSTGEWADTTFPAEFVYHSISPVNQAFTYLKSRLKGLGPMFVFVAIRFG